MNDARPFRARLIFHVLRPLAIKAREHPFEVGGQPLVLSALGSDALIVDSQRLVINGRGFRSEEDAANFARKLRAALDVSSIATRYGIDSGIDRSTGGFTQHMKELIRREQGVLVRDNIHGVDVFPDDPKVVFTHLNMRGSALVSPEDFFDCLPSLMDSAENTSPETKDVILLLNYALMRPEPVAQIVFAVSAVEMLGQKFNWSPEQKVLLDQLASEAKRSELGTAAERSEVFDAIKKMHKLSLRQGVFRLLDSLGLGDLKKEWDALYAKRSALVHGLAPKPGAEYGQLATDTLTLCGRILLTVVAKEVAPAGRYVDRFYGASK